MKKSIRLILYFMLTLLLCLTLTGCGDQLYASDLLKKADSLYQNKKYDAAKNTYTGLATQYPNSPEGKKANDILQNYDATIEQLQQAEAAQKLAEQKAYEESIKPPVELLEAITKKNIIGEPMVSLGIKNNSQKTIDAYTISVYCYNNFNTPLKEFGAGSDHFKGISQHPIAPGQTAGYEGRFWTLHGFETATKVEVVLEKIHFTDDTTWTPVKEQKISVKGSLSE